MSSGPEPASAPSPHPSTEVYIDDDHLAHTLNAHCVHAIASVASKMEATQRRPNTSPVVGLETPLPRQSSQSHFPQAPDTATINSTPMATTTVSEGPSPIPATQGSIAMVAPAAVPTISTVSTTSSIGASPRFVPRRSKVTREGVPDFEGKALTRAWGTASVGSEFAYQQTNGSISSTSSTYSQSPQRNLKVADNASISGHDLNPVPIIRRAAPEFGAYAIRGQRPTMEDAHLAIPNITDFSKNSPSTTNLTGTLAGANAQSATDLKMLAQTTTARLLTPHLLSTTTIESPTPHGLEPVDCHSVTLALSSHPNSPSFPSNASVGSPACQTSLQSPYPPSRVRTRLLSAASAVSALSSVSQPSSTVSSNGHQKVGNQDVARASPSSVSSQDTKQNGLDSTNRAGSAASSSTGSNSATSAQEPPQAPVTRARRNSRSSSVTNGSVGGSSSRRTRSAGQTRPPPLTAAANCRGFFCVCDGHGGSRCSEWVSDNLAPILFSHPQFNTDVVTAVHDAFAEVERRWLELSKAEDIDSGTTVLTALLQNNQLIVSNVGDSEAVLCRGGKAVPVSVAHNLKSNPMERERLEAMGAKIYKQRLGHPALSERFFSIAVTRAIGDILYKDEEFTMGKPSGLIATPETKVLELTQQDQFLILACDGLWDVMSHQEACDLVLRAQERLRQENLEVDWKFLAKMLATRAVKQGSTDNITVLIINLDGSSEHGNAYNIGPQPPTAPPTRATDRRREGRVSSTASSGGRRSLGRKLSTSHSLRSGALGLAPEQFGVSDESELEDEVVSGSIQFQSNGSPSKGSPRYHQRSATTFVASSGVTPAVSGVIAQSSIVAPLAGKNSEASSMGPTRVGKRGKGHMKGLSMRSTSNVSTDESYIGASARASNNGNMAPHELHDLSPANEIPEVVPATDLPVDPHASAHTTDEPLPGYNHNLGGPNFAVSSRLHVDVDTYGNGETTAGSAAYLNTSTTDTTTQSSEHATTVRQSSLLDILGGQAPSTHGRTEDDETVTGTNTSHGTYADRIRPFGLSPIHSPAQASSAGTSSSIGKLKSIFDDPNSSNTTVAGFYASIPTQEAGHEVEGFGANSPTHYVPSDNPAHNGGDEAGERRLSGVFSGNGQGGLNLASTPTNSAASVAVPESSATIESEAFFFERMSPKIDGSYTLPAATTMTMTERILRDVGSSNRPKKYNKYAARKLEQSYNWDFDDDNDNSLPGATVVPASSVHIAGSSAPKSSFMSMFASAESPPSMNVSGNQSGMQSTTDPSSIPAVGPSATPSTNTPAPTVDRYESKDSQESVQEGEREVEGDEDESYGGLDHDEGGIELCERASIGSLELATLCCGMEELKEARVDSLLETDSNPGNNEIVIPVEVGAESGDELLLPIRNSTNPTSHLAALFDEGANVATPQSYSQQTSLPFSSEQPACSTTEPEALKKYETSPSLAQQKIVNSLLSVFQPFENMDLSTPRGRSLSGSGIGASIGASTNHTASSTSVRAGGIALQSQPQPLSPMGPTSPTLSASVSTQNPAAVTTVAGPAADGAGKPIRSKEQILDDIMNEHFFTIKGPIVRNGRSNLMSLFDPEPDAEDK